MRKIGKYLVNLTLRSFMDLQKEPKYYMKNQAFLVTHSKY